MKRVRLLTLLALAVLTLSLLLSACGGNGSETTPAPSTPPAAFSDISEYTIVYPTDVDPDVFRVVRELQAAIKAATGKNLPLREDFVGLGQSVPTDTKEILIGLTNRAESTSCLLRRDDTGIYFENNRLVITGGDSAAMIEALQKYIATYIRDGACYYPTTADVVRGTYPYSAATLNGVPLGEYVIVRDTENSAMAVYLRDKIAEKTGYVLQILSPRDTAATNREIVLGKPAGDGRTPPSTAPADTFVMETGGTRLYFHGGSADAPYSAILSAFLPLLETEGDTLALNITKVSGACYDMSLFSLNLPKTFAPMTDLYGVQMTTDAVMARFEAAKAELPDEVTVLERVELEDYPLSLKLQVYVSPDGNDKNPGTKEAPFATLTKAAEAVANKNGGVIWMMGGTYEISTTVQLASKHSGSRQAPLFIKAYEDADVTLTANTTISTDSSLWHFVDAAENLGVYERLPEEARDEILYTKLSDHGLTSAAFAEITKSAGPPKLYVGGEEYTLARYPNDTGDRTDLLYFTAVYDTGTVTSDQCSVYWPWVERATAAGKDPVNWIVGWELGIPESDERGKEILSWVNTGDIWYFGSTYSGWEFGYYNIALETEGQYWAHTEEGEEWYPSYNGDPLLGYPKGSGKYSLKSVQPNSMGAMLSSNSPAGRNTFYLFNAVEALDAPGEWFLDRDTGILYVYPDGDISKTDMAVSGSTAYSLIEMNGVSDVVIDGIDVSGSNSYGYLMAGCNRAVMQNLKTTNTQNSGIVLRSCTNTAILYSDFSSAYAAMVSMSDATSHVKLEPTGIVIQNNVFHDAAPTYQTAIGFAGCQVVISHNYFQDCVVSGTNTAECIIEYNVFEGGSADVTDGGMIYTWGWANRGNHYRYNLIHMFNATHNAIYNDGTASGHYTYGNTISFLGSKSNRNLGWYSSTGMGNVCVGNLMILRNPYQVAAANSPDGAEDGNVVPANSGDALNESGLFYYYFGDEYAGTGSSRYYSPVSYDGKSQLSYRLYQSEAGHWWYDMKKDEYKRYYEMGGRSQWLARDPAFMNLLQGTQIILAAYDDPSCDYHPKYFYVPWYLTGKTFTYEGLPADAVIEIPQYTYLDAGGRKVVEEAHIAERNDDGSITLTYEEIAALERFRRQPAVCVISDNVLLGGTPTYEGGKFTETSNPGMIVTDGVASYEHYVPTSLVENNFYEYLYGDILMDADGYDYDWQTGVLESLQDTLSEKGYALIFSIDWTDAGLSYRYTYRSGTR
ncbi:MAG: right-handed parallel beta-helix repeat-containing protein [Clostridia bacterium]|nr:right-handed parallel beta-helix repeat-containing protein [Clostridia bacterium]